MATICNIYHEGKFDVCYDYQPPEDPEGVYPGCEPSLAITSVLWNGVDVTDAVKADAETLNIFSDLALDHAVDMAARAEWHREA